jgi:hypothetical protein
MKKYGGFIPGIRPGNPTTEHLGYVLSRLTAAGAVYLGVIALFPVVTLDSIGIGSEYLSSGTSLLIMVGVGLDTVNRSKPSCDSITTKGSCTDGYRGPENSWNLGAARGIKTVVKRREVAR